LENRDREWKGQMSDCGKGKIQIVGNIEQRRREGMKERETKGEWEVRGGEREIENKRREVWVKGRM